jgi:hypothetical protein
MSSLALSIRQAETQGLFSQVGVESRFSKFVALSLLTLRR